MMLKPYIYYYEGRLIYAIDCEGVHHTTERYWYEYMTMRTMIPKLVVEHTSKHELVECLRAKGVNV